MKITLFLLSFIASIIMSTAVIAEVNDDSAKHGTAVIAAKTQIKGGDNKVLILPPNLTQKQGELLTFAYKVAKEDGHKHPEYFQGLLYQESQAGGMKGYQVAGQEFGLKTLERYYGVAQVKLIAAKEALKHFPSLGIFRTDEEIIAKLITDDHWNIRISSKYLLVVSRGKSAEAGLVSYNKGEYGARGVDPSTNNYATSILRHSKTVIKSLNANTRVSQIKISKGEHLANL